MVETVSQTSGLRHSRAWLGWATAAAIFIADCFLPLGVAQGALYVIPVLLGLWVPGRRYTWLMMLTAAVLTIFGYFLSPALTADDFVRHWHVLANRFISILGISAAGFFVLHHKTTEVRLVRETHAREQAQQKLIEQKALARLGEMAAVVAHEVKNPLAGIAGAIQIIGERLPVEARERQVVSDILKRIESLNRTIQDLLLFARPRQLNKRPVQVMSLLRETADLVTGDANYQSVKIEIDGEPLICMIDPEMFREVCLNLLLNAVQAMQGQGRVRVHAVASAGGCCVSIADDGPGIPPAVLPRIFEPFYSTKGRGTGLGLCIARRIVEVHGGAITIACPPAGGTTVQISLPHPVMAEPGASEIIPAS